ncbi:UNVERIFIED_CONTAM: hypothetical protein FKN15_018446 [Acipenser sinensis]
MVIAAFWRPTIDQFYFLLQSSYPSMNQSGMMGSNSPYSQPMNNNSGAMNPQGPAYDMGSSSAGLMDLAGDMMNAADPKLPWKPEPESKEDGIPPPEPKTKASSLQHVDSIPPPEPKTKVSSLQHVDSIPPPEPKTKVSSLQHVDSIPPPEPKTKAPLLFSTVDVTRSLYEFNSLVKRVLEYGLRVISSMLRVLEYP